MFRLKERFYPGMSDLDLNFNYTQSPMWDDYQTVALWHMDKIPFAYVYYVPDNNLVNPTRGNPLALFNRANDNTVAGPMTSLSNAVCFNGSNRYGVAICAPLNNLVWQSYKTAKVDVWFKAGTTFGDHTLVDANSIWELRQHNSDRIWYVTNNGPGWPVNSATVPNCVDTNWHHATATVDASGNMTLTVDNTTATGVAGSGNIYPNPMKTSTVGIYVGQTRNIQYFNGSLDDIKISQYRIP